MRFFSPSLAIGLLLLLCCLHATTPSVRGYYFSESKEDLATLESTPGVSIVYPRAVGPSATEVEGAPSDVKGSEEVATAATTTTTAPPTTTTTTATADAEAATTTTTTTTAAPTTTDASSSESTPGMATFACVHCHCLFLLIPSPIHPDPSHHYSYTLTQTLLYTTFVLQVRLRAAAAALPLHHLPLWRLMSTFHLAFAHLLLPPLLLLLRRFRAATTMAEWTASGTTTPRAWTPTPSGSVRSVPVLEPLPPLEELAVASPEVPPLTLSPA